jgi:hypothetical protein
MVEKNYFVVGDRTHVLHQGDFGSCEAFLKENRNTVYQTHSSVAIYTEAEFNALSN